MYIIDFFRTNFRRANAAVLIYLLLNTALIVLLVDFMFSGMMMWDMYMSPAGAHITCAIVGLLTYFLSVAIALSPFGEWIVRIQAGCERIQRQDQLDYLMPLFQNVYAKAKQTDPNLSDDIQLFINDDPAPNAFATGRKTICLTEGLMHLPPRQIEGIFAHEFGHLSHRDTDMLLVISVGNMIVTGIVLLGKIIMSLFKWFITIGCFIRGGNEGFLIMVITWILHFFFIITISALSKLWSMIGVMLVNKSGRENEFEADAFAASLGYGYEVCAFLDAHEGDAPRGVFASFASTHPGKNDRIARLQNYRGPVYGQRRQPAYRNNYGIGHAQEQGQMNGHRLPAPGIPQGYRNQPTGAPRRYENRPSGYPGGGRENRPSGYPGSGRENRNVNRRSPDSRNADYRRPDFNRPESRRPDRSRRDQTAVCRCCGAPLRPGIRFCTSCGTPVAAGAAGGPGSGRPTGTGSGSGRPAGNPRGRRPAENPEYGRPAGNPRGRRPAENCPRCGARPSREGIRFCTRCGQRLA